MSKEDVVMEPLDETGDPIITKKNIPADDPGAPESDPRIKENGGVGYTEEQSKTPETEKKA